MKFFVIALVLQTLLVSPTFAVTAGRPADEQQQMGGWGVTAGRPADQDTAPKPAPAPAPAVQPVVDERPARPAHNYNTQPRDDDYSVVVRNSAQVKELVNRLNHLETGMAQAQACGQTEKVRIYRSHVSYHRLQVVKQIVARDRNVSVAEVQSALRKMGYSGPASDWAEGAVNQAIASGLMVGRSRGTTASSDDWQKPAKREEVAAVAVRLKGRIEDHKKDPNAHANLFTAVSRYHWVAWIALILAVIALVLAIMALLRRRGATATPVTPVPAPGPTPVAPVAPAPMAPTPGVMPPLAGGGAPTVAVPTPYANGSGIRFI